MEHQTVVIVILGLMWAVTLAVFLKRELTQKQNVEKLGAIENRLSSIEYGHTDEIQDQLRDLRNNHQQRASESAKINDLIDGNFKIVTDNFKTIDERFNEARAKSDRMDQSLKLILEV